MVDDQVHGMRRRQPNRNLGVADLDKHLLSFVTDEDGDQVFIHADLAGVNFLIRQLHRIKEELEEDDCPHAHLVTKRWGGSELSESRLADQEDETNQVHHVKIYGWNDEWRRKHRMEPV